MGWLISMQGQQRPPCKTPIAFFVERMPHCHLPFAFVLASAESGCSCQQEYFDLLYSEFLSLGFLRERTQYVAQYTAVTTATTLNAKSFSTKCIAYRLCRSRF